MAYNIQWVSPAEFQCRQWYRLKERLLDLQNESDNPSAVKVYLQLFPFNLLLVDYNKGMILLLFTPVQHSKFTSISTLPAVKYCSNEIVDSLYFLFVVISTASVVPP